MVRYLTAILFAMVLVAAGYRLVSEDPAIPAATATETVRLPAAKPEPPTEVLDEIDVRSVRRIQALEACVFPGGISDDERMAGYAAQGDDILRVLGSSTDAEHLLVAALVSWRRAPEDALSLLRRAESAAPRHPLVAAQMLDVCVEIDLCGGARPEMERNLIVADSANAMAWVQVARSRLKRKNEAGALAAMREAAAAPEIRDYFSNNVLLFERGLAASTDLPAIDRMVAAVGHAAAVSSSSYRISSDCLERAKGSAEWRDVCLRLGQKLEHVGRTILSQSIGMNIQSKMYEYGGDTREQQDVEARYARYADDYLSLMPHTTRSWQLRDATVFRRYLETFESAGELAAMRYLAAEVEARLPEPAAANSSTCPTP